MEKKWIVIRLSIFYLNQPKNLVAAVVAIVLTIHQRRKLPNGMNTMKHLEISNAVGLQSWVIKFFTHLTLIIYNYILYRIYCHKNILFSFPVSIQQIAPSTSKFIRVQ